MDEARRHGIGVDPEALATGTRRPGHPAAARQGTGIRGAARGDPRGGDRRGAASPPPPARTSARGRVRDRRGAAGRRRPPTPTSPTRGGWRSGCCTATNAWCAVRAAGRPGREGGGDPLAPGARLPGPPLGRAVRRGRADRRASQVTGLRRLRVDLDKHLDRLLTSRWTGLPADDPAARGRLLAHHRRRQRSLGDAGGAADRHRPPRRSRGSAPPSGCRGG